MGKIVTSFTELNTVLRLLEGQVRAQAKTIQNLSAKIRESASKTSGGFYGGAEAIAAELRIHIANANNPHSVSDENLIVTDVTDNDVSILAHGFCPKAPNDVNKYLSGLGTWVTLPGTDVLSTGTFTMDNGQPSKTISDSAVTTTCTILIWATSATAATIHTYESARSDGVSFTVTNADGNCVGNESFQYAIFT